MFHCLKLKTYLPKTFSMKTWHLYLIVAVCWAAIFLPGLSQLELRGEEPRRVLPGLEMIRSGDWITPQVAGEEYHRKPPLVNWLAAWSFLALGEVGEFAARLPAVLSVLALVLVLVGVASRFYGMSGGLFAAVVLLTNIGLLEKGRLIEIEALYIALFGIGWLLWYLLWKSDRSAWLYWLVPAPVLGLAWLAKGPPYLVFYYATIVALLWSHKHLKALAHPAHWVSLVVQAAVFVPWMMAVAARSESAGGASATAQDQILSRLSFGDIDWVGWPLAIVQGVVNYLPWAVVLVVFYFARGREKFGIPARDRDRTLNGLLWGVAVGYFVVALLPESRPRFTLPLMVPATVLLAHCLAMMSDEGRGKFVIVWRRCLRVGLLLVGVVAVVVPFFAEPDQRMMTAVGSVVVVVAVFGVWNLLALKDEGQVDRLSLLTATWAALAVALFVFAVAPHLKDREKLRPTGLALKELVEDGERLVLYKAGYQPSVFYAWPQVIEWSSWDDLPTTAAGMPDVFVMELKDWEKGSEGKKLIARFGEPEVIREIENKWGDDEPFIALRF